VTTAENHSKTFRQRGFERRTVRTADIKLGDHIHFVGAGLACPIVKIQIDGEWTYITVAYEVSSRRRHGVIARRTAGRSTIHVRTAERVS
jgi:hypothetical protein